jgi:hypothetical protein
VKRWWYYNYPSSLCRDFASKIYFVCVILVQLNHMIFQYLIETLNSQSLLIAISVAPHFWLDHKSVGSGVVSFILSSLDGKAPRWAAAASLLLNWPAIPESRSAGRSPSFVHDAPAETGGAFLCLSNQASHIQTITLKI